MSAWNVSWSDTAWETEPLLVHPCRGATEDQLERLKEQLLAPLLSSVKHAALIRELRWVANEAAALAWLTACPMLVLPELLAEKVSAALRRWERQRLLLKHQAPATAVRDDRESALFAPVVMAA